jgi:hypothetical protein
MPNLDTMLERPTVSGASARVSDFRTPSLERNLNPEPVSAEDFALRVHASANAIWAGPSAFVPRVERAINEFLRTLSSIHRVR